MKTKTYPPTPAATQAMIQACWLKLFHWQTSHDEAIYWQGFGDRIYADTYASPFIVRLYHSNPCDPRVAYLSALHGIAERRFGIKTLGYANCSVVTDPGQTIWLDSLFWHYLDTDEQKKDHRASVGHPKGRRGPHTDRQKMKPKKKAMNWNNTNTMKVKPYIFITAFAYVYLFAYTAHAKLVGHAEFVTTLGKSPLIGPEYAHFIAWAIPIVEALLALLLIFPPTMKKALWASMSLMVVFTTYLIYMVASGLPRTCNCGGVIESLTWAQHILFNLILIAVVPITLYWKKIKPLFIKGLRGFKRVFKKLFTNNLYHMLRLTVLGLALGAIAVGNSAYTQKAENEMLVGEVYVNTSTSPDQYQMLAGTYDDNKCQNTSNLTCSYIRTDFEPSHELPSSFTDEEAQEFVAAGWLEPNSNKEGLYIP